MLNACSNVKRTMGKQYRPTAAFNFSLGAALALATLRGLALARALVKDADLILFDEPLVNLDYKLREALRDELRELFKTRNCIAVYATTEPNEALALGGNTAVLHEGKLLQYGATEEIYRKPNGILSAEMFSEPPINIVPGHLTEEEITFDHDIQVQSLTQVQRRSKYSLSGGLGEYVTEKTPIDF